MMRRPTAAVLAVILSGVLASPSVAGKKPHQHVEGSIVVPQTGGPAGACVYRTQRTIMATTGQPNGVVGYTFDVDPKTAGKKFVLDVADGAGMDISFYMDLGDPSDPTTAPGNVGYETPGAGGEKGTVPKGYPIAFVCMTEGANATFTYKAGAGV